MDIQDATPEQIGMFKAGAAAQFKARNVPPEMAEAMFNDTMGKLAAELGIVPQMTPKAAALYTHIKSGMCGADHDGNMSYPGDHPRGKKKMSKKAATLAVQIQAGLSPTA